MPMLKQSKCCSGWTPFQVKIGSFLETASSVAEQMDGSYLTHDMMYPPKEKFQPASFVDPGERPRREPSKVHPDAAAFSKANYFFLSHQPLTSDDSSADDNVIAFSQCHWLGGALSSTVLISPHFKPQSSLPQSARVEAAERSLPQKRLVDEDGGSKQDSSQQPGISRHSNTAVEIELLVEQDIPRIMSLPVAAV
ncbi:hypothetical protein F2P81_001182 [Scophthalmus maximus]|uniref:Uncharacterized protein n=1 Tax=Scophthalmus maximus TaxID=52904 RepID=A0A6A4TRM5_SCOMX|nr:hypothetical protein F2P81_001182 [Scophthalmus maximus]